MTNRAALALVLGLQLAACWTGSAPTAPTEYRATAEQADEAPPRRTTQWHPPPPREATAPEGGRDPADLARELAMELRSHGPTLLPTFIAGPIVVLDLDAGTLSTICDTVAVTNAQAWGQLLADPNRSRVHCRSGASTSCSQSSSSTILIIELDDPDAWRIVSVIIGNIHGGRTTFASHLVKMRAMIDGATCP